MWKEELISKFEARNYKASFALLENNLQKGIDEECSYLSLIYVYLEIIVESEIENHFSYIRQLQYIVHKAFCKYKDCANFLFNIAYMASSYGEMFLGLNETEVQQMFRKAVCIQPSNLLYQWGNNIYNNTLTEKQRKEYALKILNSKEYMNEICSFPLLSKDLLKHLRIDIQS